MALTLALIALIVAGITCVTAIINLRTSRGNREQIKEIHILVNSKFSAAIARVDQLTKTLKLSDVDIPLDPHPQDDFPGAHPRGKSDGH